MTYDIASNKASQKAILMVLQGKARIIKEAGTIYLSSAGKTVTVHPNFRYIFDAYLEKHGNGDGLFKGTSQTEG